MIPRLRPAIGLWELWSAGFGTGTVSDFERAFADLAGQREAVAFPYGRTALMILFEALGLEKREIIVPAYTCVVVPHAVVYSGNLPRFVDCAPGDVNMDLGTVDKTLSGAIGAVVATSIFGYPIDLERLSDFRRRHPDIPVVQDCAHSFFASYSGRPVHREGVAAVFGLNFGKMMTSIFGGMVTTDNVALAERLRALRARRLWAAGAGKWVRRFAYLYAGSTALSRPFYTVVDRIRRTGIIDRFVEYYDEAKIDMPSDYLQEMCDVEARVGLVQTVRYDGIVARRRANARLYDRLLQDMPGTILPRLIEGGTYAYYAPQVIRRDEVICEMARRGIELGHVLEYCIPEMPAYARYSKPEKTFPVAAGLARSVVNLPVHIDEKTVRRVAAVLRNVMQVIAEGGGQSGGRSAA